MIHRESLETLPVLSRLRFITGKGHTPGPARTGATGQGWRIPGLRLLSSLPPTRGLLSTLPPLAAKNASPQTQGTHLRPSAPSFIGGWSCEPPVPGTYQISQLPEESRCSTETTLLCKQSRDHPLSVGKVSCWPKGLAPAHCPE